MSQELPDPYEVARLRFTDAVEVWRRMGANKDQMLNEIEFIFSIDNSSPEDPAAVKGWEE